MLCTTSGRKLWSGETSIDAIGVSAVTIFTTTGVSGSSLEMTNLHCLGLADVGVNRER